MICKITGVYKRPMSFFWRLVFYFLVGGNIDEIITKAEADFFLKIAPQLANTNCRVPKSYFGGKVTESNSVSNPKIKMFQFFHKTECKRQKFFFSICYVELIMQS